MMKKILSYLKINTHGGVPDETDSRDLPFGALVGGEWESKIAALPKEYSLNYPESNFYNQGWTSACVFHAACVILNFLFKKRFSPRFLAKYGFQISNLAWGAYIRDGIKAIDQVGTCEYYLRPNDSQNTLSDYLYKLFSPNKEELNQAEKSKKWAYARIDSELNNSYDFDLCRLYIWENSLPVLFGYKWYENWNGCSSGAKLITGGGQSTGHAGACIGWNGDYYIVVDSYLRIIWLHKSNLTYDFWGIVDPEKYHVGLRQSLESRNKEKEQQAAVVLKNELYAKFAKTDIARTVAFQNWFLLVDAYTYRGYTLQDLVNWVYAKSRGKNLPFDLTQKKNILG